MTSAQSFTGRIELMRSNISPNLSDLRSLGKRLMRTGSVVAIALAALFLAGCATTRVKDTSRTFTTVVIDAGHGGYDDGTKSRWGGKEKNATLSVALKLDAKLRAAGFKTVLTRKDDRFVELNDRASISNRQRNAIFVSIHFNDSRNRGICGTEVYYRSPISEPIAERILHSVSALPGCHARFVKTANFRVLKRNEYPAVLVECGYLSNRREGSMCCTPAQHDRFADAIATAICEQRGRNTYPAGPVASAVVGKKN
jgi:N-acetylmuramoyl-L-alanine amidase